jgi:Flp pilus assembly protein TadG
MHQLQLTKLRAIVARFSLRRFARAETALAAVEFALILPVLVTLYFGTIEGSALYSADRRVATIAGTIGDLVARSKNTIASATLTDYFQASAQIIKPYSSTGLTQVVTFLTVNASGVATVTWSRAYNGGIARTTGATYSLAAVPQMKTLATGSFIVMAEVKYPYKPLYGMVIPQTINLFHVEYFLPRFGKTITIT